MPHESTQYYQLQIVDETGEVSNTIWFDKGYHFHADDSIRAIKCKILLELHEGKYTESVQLKPVYEELYLYAKAKGGKLIPIGIQHDSKTSNFEANPYKISSKEDRENLTYNDASLLLNYGEIEEHTLYLCVASRVVDDENEDYVFRYYYPFLYNKGIQRVADLIKKRASLMATTR